MDSNPESSGQRSGQSPKPHGLESGYLIHWTSSRPAELADRDGGTTALSAATKVDDEAELVGFLLNLPGDGSFVVRAVTVADIPPGVEPGSFPVELSGRTF